MAVKYHPKGFRLFSGQKLREYIGQFTSQYKSQIENESESFILNVNEQTYIEHLESLYRIEPPQLHFDNVSADSYEANITQEHISRHDAYLSGEFITREIIQYYIPCTGDASILEKSPSSYTLWDTSMFDLKENCLVIEFINLHNNADIINNEYNKIVNEITPIYKLLINEIETFNSSISGYAKHLIGQRKEKFLKKNNLLSSLNVPLRNKNNTSSTFTVPKPKLRERVTVKPVVLEKEFKPEPSLDSEHYNRILKIINDVGKNFERLPSVYKSKGEEDLRDHILFTLDPNFEYGSATGETFNMSGKTDIQLRYDSSVVFIAECKFWNGEKIFHKTIDQLLSYLTWRDTKTAIIFFVRQRDFTAILNKIKNEAANHSNYLGYINSSDENWFNFRFHLNADRNREIKLAIQLFHLPIE